MIAQSDISCQSVMETSVVINAYVSPRKDKYCSISNRPCFRSFKFVVLNTDQICDSF